MRTRRHRGTVHLCASVHFGCKGNISQDGCPIEPHTGSENEVIECSAILSRGDHLFREGDLLKSLYVIHSGSVKCYLGKHESTAQVVKFCLPGDLVGIDGLADHRHTCSAQTLETTSVCRVFVASPSDSAVGNPRFPWHLLRLASREMVSEYVRTAILTQRDAGVRLALFLLRLSQRYGDRGFSELEFNLSMSRRDIGSYLALQAETVSRMFSQFERIGLVEVDRRRIRLLSIERLRDMVPNGWPSQVDEASFDHSFQM